MFITDFGPTKQLAGYYDLERQRMYGAASIPLSPDEVPANFPFDIWTWQAEKYLGYWQFFVGSYWAQEVPDEKDEHNKPVLVYPLQINPIKTIAMKHSYILIGEAPDTPDPLIPMKVTPRKHAGEKEPSDERKVTAEEAQLFINQVWKDNNGRALQQEQALIMQFLGGCVYRINWAPDDDEIESGIRIEKVIPDFFLPVWDNGRPDTLLEAWVIYRMEAREATIRFGYSGTEVGYYPLYVEHWTRDRITITIGGEPVSYRIGNQTIVYNDVRNPFGFVPFVYIPRERAGGFYGLSVCDDLIGLAEEFNARMADIGDVIGENAHRDIIGRNIQRAVTTKDMGLVRPVVDIGLTPSVSKDKPELFTLDPNTLLNSSVMDYPAMLKTQIDNDSFTPAVAYGLDEGSQRSALTLAFRFQPLTSKTRSVRTYVTTGMCNIAKMILKIAAIKQIAGIGKQHLTDLDFAPVYAPMIPRDREQQVDEAVSLAQTNLKSPQTAIEQLGYTDDPVEEMKRIKDYLTWKSGMETQQKLKLQKVSPPSTALGEKGAPYTAVE